MSSPGWEPKSQVNSQLWDLGLASNFPGLLSSHLQNGAIGDLLDLCKDKRRELMEGLGTRDDVHNVTCRVPSASSH